MSDKISEIIKKKGDNPLHPFTTPDGYFDTFKERLMARIAEEESHIAPKKKGKILHRLRPYLYIAAAVACLVVALYAWGPIATTTPTNQLKAEEMTDDEFHQFLLDDTSDDYWGILFMNDDYVITSSR